MIMWQCGNFFKNLFFKVSKNSKILRKLEVKYIRNKTCQKIENESGSDFVIKGGLISEVTIFILAPSSKNVWTHYPQYYGNTGCGVFKPGVWNYKDFCLKINILKGNYWILRIGLAWASEVFKNQNFKSQIFPSFHAPN